MSPNVLSLAFSDIDLRWEAFYRDTVAKRLSWRQLGDEMEWRTSLLQPGATAMTFKRRKDLIIGEEFDAVWPSSKVELEPKKRSERTADDYRRLRAMRKPHSGLPRPNLAWQIAQAARPFVEWSCGPVGLWASGHHRHLIGFLATWWCDLAETTLNDADFRPLLQFRSLPYLLEHTVFDHLPFLADTYALMKTLDEAAYAKFARGMEPVVSEAQELLHVDRTLARDNLVLNEQQLLTFDRLWHKWWAVQDIEEDWPIEFRLAYACCTPDFSITERERIFMTAVCSGFMNRLQDHGHYQITGARLMHEAPAKTFGSHERPRGK
ncbi:MAG: hypothetical protein JO325_24640 [Solirubrobacterales bacterium]|nr:hypothetical protein [Solirubrobacterales bacterium]